MGYFPQGLPSWNGLRHILIQYENARSWVTGPLAQDKIRFLKANFAHLDDQGEPDRWLFDTLLVLMSPSTGNMIFADVNRGTTMSGEGDFYAIPAPNPATKRDWDEILDALFGRHGYLSACDEALRNLAGRLGVPSRRNILLAIPYPHITQAMFGRLDPGGPNLNFSVVGQPLYRATAQRLEAARWFVRETHRRWTQAGFQHLHLLGFYWVFETVYRGWDVDDHYVLKELRKEIHGLGYRLTWIPFWSSYNVHLLDNYQDYYFDLALLQPNYMFYQNLQGVDDAARAARERHAGLAIEYFVDLDEPIQVGGERHKRLKEYLDAGVRLGYMTESVCAYFIGPIGMWDLYNAPGVEREVYEALSRFVQGSYTPGSFMP